MAVFTGKEPSEMVTGHLIGYPKNDVTLTMCDKRIISTGLPIPATSHGAWIRPLVFK